MKKIIKELAFLVLYYSSTILRKRKTTPPNKPGKILVISWQLIGDTFLSLSTIVSLKKYFNNCKIIVVCKPIVKDLFAHMIEVDNIIVLEDDFLNNRHELKRLRDKYDLTIDLTNNLPSAFFSLLSDGIYKTGGSGIYKVLGKRFVGFPFIYDKIYSPPNNDYIITYFYKIVLNVFPEFKIDETWKFDVSSIQVANRKNYPNQIFVGFGLGASRNEKRWDSKNWVNLAKTLTSEYNVTVFLMGGPAENELSAKINEQTNEQVVSLVGKTNLLEAAKEVKYTDCFISNDTGLMHVAIHYMVPTICLIGPSNDLNYIPKNNPIIKTVIKKIFCQPCYNFLNLADNTLHHDCKYNIPLCERLITVKDVLIAFEELNIVKNKS